MTTNVLLAPFPMSKLSDKSFSVKWFFTKILNKSQFLTIYKNLNITASIIKSAEIKFSEKFMEKTHNSFGSFCSKSSISITEAKIR